MVLVEIVPCILRTSNIWSALYLRVSGIIVDLVSFCVVDLRVSAYWDILSPHLSLRYSAVVLECLFLDKNVRGILTSFMVSTCSSVTDACCVVFYFEIISATIRAAIMSALYFLSLLRTTSNISRFLYIFTVNIADTCVVVTATPATRCLRKFPCLHGRLPPRCDFWSHLWYPHIVGDMYLLVSPRRSTLLPSRHSTPLTPLAQNILFAETQFCVDYSVGRTLTQCVDMTRVFRKQNILCKRS